MYSPRNVLFVLMALLLIWVLAGMPFAIDLAESPIWLIPIGLGIFAAVLFYLGLRPAARRPSVGGSQEVIGTPLQAPVRTQHTGVLAVVGYVAAIAAPILAVVFAAILIARGETRHGVGVLLIGAASWLFRLVLLTHGGAA